MRRRHVFAALGRADIAPVADLHAMAFEEAWSAVAIETIMDKPQAFGLVSRPAATARRGPLSGFALCRVAAEECEVLSLAVARRFRKAGLARALLGRALDAARTRGARAAFLEVAVDNAAATRLYGLSGFVEVGRRRGYYARLGEPAADAITMRRALDEDDRRAPALNGVF